jgi:N-acyl-D-aspartate/D-glutamate deacylase
VFQGNWQRVIIAVPVKPENADLANRTIAEISREAGRDPLDVLLDLGLDENLETGLIGRFFNAVDEGVEPVVKHNAGVIALSDARARLVYLCDAGFRLYLLGHWCANAARSTSRKACAPSDEPSGRALRHPGSRRIAIGAHADLLLFDPAKVGISALRRLDDLPGGGTRTIRDPIGVHGVFVNGTRVFDGKNYERLEQGPGQVVDRFLRPARLPWRAQRSSLGRESGKRCLSIRRSRPCWTRAPACPPRIPCRSMWRARSTRRASL